MIQARIESPKCHYIVQECNGTAPPTPPPPHTLSLITLNFFSSAQKSPAAFGKPQEGNSTLIPARGEGRKFLIQNKQKLEQPREKGVEKEEIEPRWRGVRFPGKIFYPHETTVSFIPYIADLASEFAKYQSCH